MADNNFEVERVFFGPEPVIAKTIDGDDMELSRRLEQELAAYDLLLEYCPELVPRVYPEIVKSTEGIATEELTNLGRTTLPTMIEAIETLQTVPVDETLPHHPYEHYRAKHKERIGYLLGCSAIQGITTLEARLINWRTDTHRWAINSFRPDVFVHTDIQKRHFGMGKDTPAGTRHPKIFDFDQAHSGNELEDFAFLSIRHPEFAEPIMTHLRAKFADNPTQLQQLDRAMKFFRDYFLVKGVYDRTHQARGDTFDTFAKAYGRAVLLAPPLQRVTGTVLSIASRSH